MGASWHKRGSSAKHSPALPLLPSPVGWVASCGRLMQPATQPRRAHHRDGGAWASNHTRPSAHRSIGRPRGVGWRGRKEAARAMSASWMASGPFVAKRLLAGSERRPWGWRRPKERMAASGVADQRPHAPCDAPNTQTLHPNTVWKQWPRHGLGRPAPGASLPTVTVARPATSDAFGPLSTQDVMVVETRYAPPRIARNAEERGGANGKHRTRPIVCTRRSRLVRFDGGAVCDVLTSLISIDR